MPTPARATPPFLSVSLRRIDLDRGERAVLRDVNWRIRPGQRWLLVGGNGAGKTQLLKLVAGSVWPTPGGCELRRYRWRGESFDMPAGVAEEIAYVGAERQDRYEHYDWNFRAHEVVGTGVQRTDIPMRALTEAERARVASLLTRLGIGALAERRFLTLSYGERRLVLIARALASRPKLLLLDEVANGLDARNHARFLTWLNGSARSKMPWIFATHRSADVPESMTHLLELEGGQVKRRGVLRARRARALLRQEPQEFLARNTVVRIRPRKRRLLVELRNADVHVDEAHVLRGIDLAVRAGDCWVVHGPNGSGKSTLLRTIYGDHGVAAGGGIQRAGIVPGVALEKFKLRTAYVAPHLQAWQAPRMEVMEVVASGRYASIGLNDAITAHDRRHAERALRRFGMFALRARTLAEMSYGQARRILFARAWAREPALALLDEPFAGLDRATRADLTRRLNEWLAEGGSCVIATHHREEWPAHTTHVLELEQGRVVSSRRVEEMKKIWLGALVAALVVAAFIVHRFDDAPIVVRLTPGPRQPEVTPAEAGIDMAAIQAAVDYAAKRNTAALVIGRGGHIVFEKYWGDTTFDTPVAPTGFAAPIGALLVGVAMHERLINNLDAPLSNYLPEYLEMPAGAETLREHLGKRVQHGEGSSTELIALMLERLTRQHYEAIVSERLWKPLGGGDISFLRNGPVEVRKEAARACCTLRARIGDWMRVGELLANDGVFEGNQLAPPRYVSLMLRPTHTDSAVGLGVNVDGSFATRDVAWLRGDQSQRLWVVPSLRLVILRVGGEPDASEGWDESMIPDSIIRGTEGWQPASAGEGLDPKRFAPH